VFATEKLMKHDQFVEDLCELLKEDYDLILKNVPIYSRRKRLVAEIDVLAYKDGTYDAFEVKCSHRITKAKQQLKKIRRAFKERINNTFFFCGESGLLMLL
jgi:predicted RecB family endonuclease